MIQWLFWMNAGLGPMQGQANHFFRYTKEKIPYAIERYINETKRLYGVLEKHFANGNQYLVGNKYSVADMSTFTWVRWAQWAGVELKEFPNVAGWVERIESRPAVKKGLEIPNGPDTIAKLKNDPEFAEKEAKKWIGNGDWMKSK